MEGAFEAFLRVHFIPLMIVLVISLVVYFLISRRIIRIIPCLLLGTVTIGLGAWALLWTMLSRFNGWVLALLAVSSCYLSVAVIGTSIGHLMRKIFIRRAKKQNESTNHKHV